MKVRVALMTSAGELDAFTCEEDELCDKLREKLGEWQLASGDTITMEPDGE